MAWSAPAVLHALLTKLADAIGSYVIYQIEAGAQSVQIFDSWGGQLTPSDWDKLSKARPVDAHPCRTARSVDGQPPLRLVGPCP